MGVIIEPKRCPNHPDAKSSEALAAIEMVYHANPTGKPWWRCAICGRVEFDDGTIL